MNTTDFSAKRVNLLIILISSFMMIVVLNLPFKAKPFGDETFHNQSKNLARYLKGDVGYDKVLITQAPGPVIFYTVPYLIAPSEATDNQLWGYATVFTFLIVTISLLLIFRIGSNLFSKEVGLLAVLLFFVFPIHCYYSLGILAEVPAFFSLSLALYGWSIALLNPNKKSGWILLALGLWFLILNRPNSMLILGLGFLVIAYSFFKNKDFFKIYARKLIVVFFGVGLLCFGVLQTAKAVTAPKTKIDQSTLFYYVAHEGRFQFREEPTDLRYWESDVRPDSQDYQNWLKSSRDLSQEMDRTRKSYQEVYRQFLINDALEHPFLFARQFFVKCFYGHVYIINSVKPSDFHLGPIHGTIAYWFVILVINFINIMLLIGAFIFLFKQKNLISYWPFWGVILALLAFHGSTYMEPRYMFPSRVALYIMSAAGLYQIKWLQAKVNFIAKFVFLNKKPVK